MTREFYVHNNCCWIKRHLWHSCLLLTVSGCLLSLSTLTFLRTPPIRVLTRKGGGDTSTVSVIQLPVQLQSMKLLGARTWHLTSHVLPKAKKESAASAFFPHTSSWCVQPSHYKTGEAPSAPGGWGSRISGQSAHEGGKVFSLTHRLSLPPGEDPRYSFLLEAESIPGP